ncbi:MAG: YraN family protein [bacterium]
MNQTKRLGNNGEQAVARWLKNYGFHIVELNYNTKYGEIDLIVSKNDLIAFVEVKTRATTYFPISTVVTRPKQKKIIKTAQIFLLKRQITEKTIRFDVATVTIENNCYKIQYIENAFQT